MGAALRRDITKLHFTDISKTINCPLARRMRKKLKKYGIYKGIDVVWSDEVVDFDYEDPDPNGPTEGPTGRVRRVLGSLPTITAIFGLMLANAAIDYLQKK
jgi:tRNA A37 threonylcarbamoyladenosine dehydratase